MNRNLAGPFCPEIPHVSLEAPVINLSPHSGPRRASTTTGAMRRNKKGNKYEEQYMRQISVQFGTGLDNAQSPHRSCTANLGQCRLGPTQSKSTRAAPELCPLRQNLRRMGRSLVAV